MRNKKTTAALTAGLLLAGTAGLALDGGTAEARGNSTTRYVAHDISGNVTMADIAAPQNGQPGFGDVLAFTQRLTRGGHTVGRVSNVAIGVDAQRNLFQANGTLTLAHGKVEFGGLVPQTSHFVLAVTGGTGRYARAHGTLTFDNVKNRQLLTLTLKR